MARRKAREIAFKLIYEDSFGVNTTKEMLSDLFDEDFLIDLNETDYEYIDSVFSLSKENTQQTDAIIANFAKGWTIDRMPRVDLALMRLALTEMLFMEDIPDAVSINEIVELSKQYSSDEGPAFINGVLGAYVRSL